MVCSYVVRQWEAQMYYFAKSARMNFEEAITATKQALQRHGFAVLAEIDLRKTMREHLAADFRPYRILSACSLKLAARAIEIDDEIGSILLCDVVVQQNKTDCVIISAADPAAKIGTVNDVEPSWIARDMRSRIEQVIDEAADGVRPERSEGQCRASPAARSLARTMV
jgi:uncharacterized protein (DUF302 family)